MADTDDRVDQMNLMWQAWNRAWSQGYVRESVSYHAIDDFWGVAGGALIGMAGGLAAIFIAETTGAVACGALAAYFTAGNPAAVAMAAEAGFTLGQLIAEGALYLFGVYCLYEYLKDRMNLLWPNAVSAYDLMVNQAPRFTGHVLSLMVDMAAREIAEAIGVLCGLLLAALLFFITYKMTTMKPGENQPNLGELVESKLNKMSQGLVQWLIPRLGMLRQRGKMNPPRLRLLQGGLPSDTVSTLAGATQAARSVIPRLVGKITRTMSSRSLVELDSTLTDCGFKLIAAEPYPQGPPGGYQLFWQKGNVLVRFKTLGESTGPRANKPHLSFGFNDGRGLLWQNDLGKFTIDGKIVAKAITAADRFNPAHDFQNNPHKFILIPNKFEMSEVDTWAQMTHFNADPGFSLANLMEIVARAGH